MSKKAKLDKEIKKQMDALYLENYQIEQKNKRSKEEIKVIKEILKNW